MRTADDDPADVRLGKGERVYRLYAGATPMSSKERLACSQLRSGGWTGRWYASAGWRSPMSLPRRCLLQPEGSRAFSGRPPLSGIRQAVWLDDTKSRTFGCARSVWPGFELQGRLSTSEPSHDQVEVADDGSRHLSRSRP